MPSILVPDSEYHAQGGISPGADSSSTPAVPSYRVNDEEGRTHLLIHLPIDLHFVDNQDIAPNKSAQRDER
jgi:hypothetical protein